MCRTPALGVTLVHEMGFGQPTSATAAAALEAAAAAAPAAAGSSAAHPAPEAATSHGGSAADSSTAGSAHQTAAWSSALPGIIAKFRAAVQAEFPQLYAWFDDASLHITVRAIIV